MVAAHDSGFDCSLYFRSGDVISNVVALYQFSVLSYQPTPSGRSGGGVITHMQGICRGRAGQFPISYVREMNPPVFRNLGTPFDPIPTPARKPTAAAAATSAKPQPKATAATMEKEHTCGNWGCGSERCKDCRGDEIVVSGARRGSKGCQADGGYQGWDSIPAPAEDEEPNYAQWGSSPTEEQPKHVGWDDNATGWRSAADEW